MTTYEYDHAAETKKMWSKLYELADIAAKVYDEEQRARKGKAKTSCEEESFFDHVPRKIRSTLRDTHPQPNLNGTSTSSSSPYSYYKVPPSSCLTKSTSPKIRSGRFKKPKVASCSSKAREIMPWWLVQVMRDMNGEDATLIFEKTLFVTDVNPTQSRFSMPFNSLITNNFLTPVEWSIIVEDIDNDKKIGVGAILVDPRSVKWGVILKRWEMKKDSGNGSWNYSLTCGWNDVVKANDLKDGDNICVWSFRCRGILCFALVPLLPL